MSRSRIVTGAATLGSPNAANFAANGYAVGCAIDEAGGDVWGDHPEYSRDEWEESVANGNTSSGYWEWCLARAESEEDEPTTGTLHLDLQVTYDLHGVPLKMLEQNLRSAIEREIGNGALTGELEAEVDSYSMAVLQEPGSLEALVVSELIRKGFDVSRVADIAHYAMMAPTDFIEDLSGSAELLMLAGSQESAK